jgi:phenylpropionate dioxygenase-like ring-hydroxylating dioxygenase large terminal subunit
MLHELEPKGTYCGYDVPIEGASDAELTQTGRGTPGGEYLRRFWQPVAYIEEIEQAPLRARILGEDLVVFRDKSAAVGVLHLHCSHRGSSLEYGRVEAHGIRCCYHGRVFDVDGSILEMPGERNAQTMCSKGKHGAYPAHVFCGIVFAYMGPPALRPTFPLYDMYTLPGMKLVHGPRIPFPCNWVQVKENAMDPAHTAVLHAWEGMFAAEFGKFPEITWFETPAGMAYVAARQVDDKIWLRSTDILAPNIHSLTSVFEDGKTLKDCSPRWQTIWTVPVDDRASINFTLCHVAAEDPTPAEVRNRSMLANGGQTGDRPYAERQRVPGDYDAISSQGAIATHSLEHLGTLDRGVVMFRRLLRRGIQEVAAGRDPHGLFRDGRVISTYGSDKVILFDAKAAAGDEVGFLAQLSTQTGQAYLQDPPLLGRAVPAPPPVPARRYAFRGDEAVSGTPVANNVQGVSV